MNSDCRKYTREALIVLPMGHDGQPLDMFEVEAYLRDRGFKVILPTHDGPLILEIDEKI